MTTISGWVTFDDRPRTNTQNSRRLAQQIGGSLPVTVASVPFGAVAVTGSVKYSNAYADDRSGSIAIIEGNWHWIDQRRQKMAKDLGDGAALIRAYQELGSKFLNGLLGTFSLAVFDGHSKRLLMAVDRMGLRPMCFCQTESGDVVFASNPRLIARHDAVASTISSQSIYDYMFFHVIPSPATIFSEIHKLEPAHFIEFSNGKKTQRVYWKPDFSTHAELSNTELEKLCMSEIRNAVSRCSPSESTGAFLSGGLDSSTVCGIANEQTANRLTAYTIGFDQEGYDEMAFARIAANHFNLDHRERYITPADIVDSVDELVSAFDEPFGNSSAIPAFFCAKQAKSDGKMQMLAGDGGDELFAGNERYATQKLFERYQSIPQFLRTSAIEPVLDHIPMDWSILTRKAKRYVEQAIVPMPMRMQTYNYLYRTQAETIFDPQFLAEIDTNNPDNSMREWYGERNDIDLVSRMLAFDWKLTLADNDIRKVTRMCENAGIEVSYPLLDDHLVRFSTMVPSNQKIRHNELRHFFKKTTKNFLPSEILNKPKQGFGLPFGEWLIKSPELAAHFSKIIDDARHRGFFRSDYLDDLQHKHQTEHAAYYGNFIWVIAALEIWLANVELSISPKNKS